MKILLIYIFFILLTAFGVSAEMFELQDADTGKVYGPFDYSNETEVVIGGQNLKLRRIQTAASCLKEKLKSIIIPSIEFRQANIVDVVNFLVEASINGDPEGVGVNVVNMGGFKPDIASEMLENQQDNFGDEFFSSPVENASDLTVTLNLRRISLYDAISVIAEVCGLEFIIDERGVVFLNDKGEVVRENKIKTNNGSESTNAPEVQQTYP